MLDHTVSQNIFPIYITLANIVLKVQISEAWVDRASSRHRLVQNNLRESLSAEKLDDQLFVRYNFKETLKIANYVEIADDIEVLPFEIDDD